MAKKGKSRRNKRQKHSFGFFLLIIAILACLSVYSYKTNPEFREQADEILSIFIKPQISQIDSSIEESSSDKAKDAGLEKERLAAAHEEAEAKTEKSFGKKEAAENAKRISLPANLELPLCPGNHGEADHQIRHFAHYTICYRESYEQAEWSAYCLTEEELVKNAGRTDDFRSDPEIATGSATPADYKKSGYDRGHLSPAADFAFDQDAMSETFYMSNMSPQKGSLNRGIWKDLESQVRLWAGEFGRVYVVSGPVLEKKPEEYKSIGENGVSVPEFYYKVILAPLYADDEDAASPEDTWEILATGYIFPNEKCEGSLDDYAVTVDEVEKRTQLDFFALLEDKVENEVEAKAGSCGF